MGHVRNFFAGFFTARKTKKASGMRRHTLPAAQYNTTNIQLSAFARCCTQLSVFAGCQVQQTAFGYQHVLAPLGVLHVLN